MRFCSPMSDSCALVLLGSISLLDPAKIQKLDMNIASTSRGVVTVQSYSFLNKCIFTGLSECQFRILLWYTQSWESSFLLTLRFHRGKILPFLTELLISTFHHIIVPNSFTPEATNRSQLLTRYEDIADITILQELGAEHLCTWLCIGLQEEEGGLMENTAQEWYWEGTGKHLVLDLLHLQCKAGRWVANVLLSICPHGQASLGWKHC